MLISGSWVVLSFTVRRYSGLGFFPIIPFFQENQCTSRTWELGITAVWERQTTFTPSLPIFLNLQKVFKWTWSEQALCITQTMENVMLIFVKYSLSVIPLGAPSTVPPLFYWMNSVDTVWSWHATLCQYLERSIEKPWILKQLHVSRDSQAGQCSFL